jgi:hypothetical protein
MIFDHLHDQLCVLASKPVEYETDKLLYSDKYPTVPGSRVYFLERTRIKTIFSSAVGKNYILFSEEVKNN